MLPAPPPRRRAVVRGLLTTAALAGLGACAPGPAASRAAAPTAPASAAPADPTAAASPSPVAPADSPAPTPSASPTPSAPSREEIVAEFADRRPAWFDMVGEGIVSGTAHWDDVALAIAARLGLRAAGFSINGDGGATFPADTVEAEVRRAGPGDVVISHMNQPGAGTGAGYRAAVPAMLAEGIVFLTLSDALAAS